MMIYQREPVFTVGHAPFVAGTIYVRNQMRLLKQREKARRRKALVERFPLLRIAASRRGVKRDSAPTRSPVAASA